MPRSEPENSSTRAALTAVGAAEEIMSVVRTNAIRHADRVVGAIATVIEETAGLRKYQRDEIIEYLMARHADHDDYDDVEEDDG